jgi:hypothetical protein
MIGVAQMRRATPRLLDTFSGLSRSDDLYWRVQAVRDRLDRCQTYITWDAILTRPFIPPTASHRHFIAPEQRVYLSATLGEGGELERAFGRSPITRLPIQGREYDSVHTVPPSIRLIPSFLVSVFWWNWYAIVVRAAHALAKKGEPIST